MSPRFTRTSPINATYLVTILRSREQTTTVAVESTSPDAAIDAVNTRMSNGETFAQLPWNGRWETSTHGPVAIAAVPSVPDEDDDFNDASGG